MDNKTKWRLILGKYSKENLNQNITKEQQNIETLLDTVYDNEYTKNKQMYGTKSNGITIIETINKVKNILNQETINKIALDAFEEYGIYELITDKNYIKNIKPDINLLKNLIMYKNYTKTEEQEKIKYMIKKIANEIKLKMLKNIDLSSVGTTNKTISTKYQKSKNIDINKTIKTNIKNYNQEQKKLYIENIYFYPNKAIKKTKNIILIVDCSGSMIKSLIYSAIISSIFYNINHINIKIILFDTRIVDLSQIKQDPIEILLNVTLGGGTDISKALKYSQKLIKNKQYTEIIMITDLFSEEKTMLKEFENIKSMVNKILILTGIEDDGKTYYNNNIAKKLEKLNISVKSYTVKQLVNYIK
jgi:Mg-chelatase subunit ChlD